MSGNPPAWLYHALDATPRLISPKDTVKLALIRPADDTYDASVFLEIWEIGGAQPVNSHASSVETFWFLKGSGQAISDGKAFPVVAGSFLLLPAGSQHRIVNNSSAKLYAITTMHPDNGFASLVEAGTPVSYDEEDLHFIRGSTVSSRG